MKKIPALFVSITLLMIMPVFVSAQNSKNNLKQPAASSSDDSKCFDETSHIINLGIGFGAGLLFFL